MSQSWHVVTPTPFLRRSCSEWPDTPRQNITEVSSQKQERHLAQNWFWSVVSPSVATLAPLVAPLCLWSRRVRYGNNRPRQCSLLSRRLLRWVLQKEERIFSKIWFWSVSLLFLQLSLQVVASKSSRSVSPNRSGLCLPLSRRLQRWLP
jgi:hypothetical protein